jgi:hypothetical protein
MLRRDRTSERFAKGEIDATAPGERMLAVLQRQHAVKTKSGGSTPDNYIAVYQSNTARFVGAAVAAEKEDGGQPQ